MSSPIVAVQPEHVSLAFLISALVAPPPPDQGWGQGFDGPTAQRVLALFLLEEIYDVSSPTLTPLPLLLDRLQRQLGQAGLVLARALVGILQSLRSPDDVVTVLQNFSTLLAQPGSTPAVATDAASIAYISTTSPLGMFLRRVRLGLSSMSIQGLAAVTDRIQQQLQPSAVQHYLPAASSSNTAAADSAALKEPAVIEAYVNQLLSGVETQGRSVPADMTDTAAARLSQSECEVPKLEYLRMAVSLAHKDMHAALSSLHRYFDSSGSALSSSSAATAVAGGLPGASSTTAASLAATAAGSSRQGKHKNHSALHSLSALHAHFGHPREALAALQELLRLVQQSGDEWGLLHALAGLCRVMAMSEGLQVDEDSNSSSSGLGPAAAAGWVGWGLLDFNRTEQQLNFQALLQRCLSTARDLRAPHIAAFAAVALCKFRLQHAAAADVSSSSSDEAGLTAAVASGAPQTAAAAAGTSLMVQRMLLDVATLEHQAAVAAAAPAQPAVAAPATTAATPGAPSMPVRSTALYNPTEAFGTGTNTNIIATVTSAAATANKGQPVGQGWRSSAAAVSQALATANLVAAAAMQLQGANSLAAVRLLMVLTGPGGEGAAAAAAASSKMKLQQQQGSQECTSEDMNQPSPHQRSLQRGAGYVTGCGVRYEDIAAGWALAVDLVAKAQGSAAAECCLAMAAAHFPITLPEQLTAAQQQLRLQKCIHIGDLSAARLACQELQSLALPQPQLDIELQLAAAEADALTQAAAGCWAEAHSAAASVFAVAAAAGMQPQAVKALLMMGQACLNAGDQAGALPYALSAVLHCQQLQLDSLLPEAVLLLAGAWQGLAAGSSGFVLDMLQQVMPAACACGGVKLKAELQEATARIILNLLQERTTQKAVDAAQQDARSSEAPTAAAAHGYAANMPRDLTQGQSQSQSTAADLGLNNSGSSSQGLSYQHDDLEAVAQDLLAAAAMYEQAGCVDRACGCWLLLAHVCNALGQVEGRNEAAANWQAAKQRLMYMDDTK